MADPPAYRDTGDDSGTPRWVKVFGTIFLVVVLPKDVCMRRYGDGRNS